MSEALDKMPITNALYGTEHPSLNRRKYKDTSVPFVSRIGDRLDQAMRDRLRRIVRGSSSKGSNRNARRPAVAGS